ncbi:MAG TPA: hypothetical protein VGI81_20365 [Tepidisphaeraceae bacterium]|jgi:hypothetical protein
MQVEDRSNEIVPQGDITPDDVTGPQDGVPSGPGAFAHPSAAIRPGLSPVQEVAMQRLIAGSSIQQAARAAQVDRRTLSRWLHNDPYFAAAYAAWQREMVASGRARVLAMTDIALDAVQNAILQGDGRVALQVAKATGALDAPKPGTTDAAWFRHRQKLRDDARQSEIRSAEFDENFNREHDPRRRVAYCEDIVDTCVKHLHDALRAEPPDARTTRLADQAKRRRDYHPMTLRLLATMDAEDAARTTEQPPLLDRPTWEEPGRESGDPELLTWRERQVLEQLRRKMLGEAVQVEEVTLAPWEVDAINETREKLLDEGFIPGADGRVVPGPRDPCGSGKPIGTRKQLESRAVPPRALPAPSPAAPPPPPPTAPADHAPAAPTATAGVDAPPASPVPQAEPAAFQGTGALSSKSVDPPPAPPRHGPPPGTAVRYDGSDDMDNEPGWVKLM